jgi:3-phenylpropionate/trans-cinnamate dioxygenase ferredoxin reductase subunit
MTKAGMVIIGAGECGVRAAFALREQGFEGGVTLIGAEAVLPYERPPLSKAGQGGVKVIRPAESYVAAGIDLRLGASVSRIDRKARSVELADGSHVPYERLLLATGAQARLFTGFEACLTLRNDQDAKTILAHMRSGARVGIIGGGFIGLELAAMARQLGATVTVFEAAPRLLARAVPEQIAAIVHARHTAEGVDLRIGAEVSAADSTSVIMADGTSLPFDVVVAGMGAVPNIDLALAAGLQVENGVIVDTDMRTSDPHIFAAGDCCNFEWRGARVRLESWKAAQDQGAHAAAAILGARAPYSKAPWFWSDQFDLTLQVTGMFDMNSPVQSRETGDDTALIFQCDNDGRLRAAAGIGTGNTVAKDIRILEKLIERGAAVDAATISDPSQNLKRLLKAA